MRFRSALVSALNLRPGEGSIVSLLLLHSMFVGIVQVFMATAASALFLVDYGADSLPLFYMVASFITVAVGLAYAQLGERLPSSTLLVANLACLLVFTIVFRVLLDVSGARWATFALLLWTSVQSALLNLEFWALAGSLFNVRQSKRLFGLVGSGEAVTTIAGGLATPFLVALIGTPNLLYIAAVGLAGCLACLLAINRRWNATPTQPHIADTAPPYRYRDLFRHRYIVLAFAFAALSWLQYYVIDNVYFAMASAYFPDADQLAGFLGILGAISGALKLAFQLFISGRIIGRYGLTAGLLALPIINAVGIGVAALVGGAFGVGMIMLWFVTFAKVSDSFLEGSLYQTSYQMLFQPLSASLRARAQTFNELVVEPLAGAVAGAALIVLVNVLRLDVIALSFVALVILVLMYAVAARLGRSYPGVLVQALSKRYLGDATLAFAEPASMAVVQNGLHSEHAGVVLYSLDLLERSEQGVPHALVERLLDHPAPDVRQEALRHIEQHGVAAALQAVRVRLVHEPDVAVRGAAVQTLAALGESEAFEEVAAFLRDPEPAVRMGAIVGLLRNGGIEGVLLAGETLIDLARSPVASQRAFAAHALGQAGIASFHRPLIALIQDTDADVQRAALGAAGMLKNPKLWSLVVDHLTSPPTHSAATAALVAGGAPALPHLRASFEQPNQRPIVRARIARICGRIGGDAAIGVLEQRIADPDDDVRHEVLSALVRCGYQPQGTARQRMLALIEVEGALAASVLAAQNDVGTVLDTVLLQTALQRRFRQSQERLFLLLSFLYDPRTMLRTRDNYFSPFPTQRAYALEVLDGTVSQDLKPLVVAMYDELTPTERWARLAALYEQRCLQAADRLRMLVVDPAMGQHPWIRACALYALLSVDPRTHQEVATDALNDAEPLVAQTAAWTLGQNWSPIVGGRTMFSTIEKVMILKGVSIFAETPDDVLAEVAGLLEDVEVPQGHTIFHKGDAGTSLYIVIDGRVRVHDGAVTLNELGEREVFGEMAVLDAMPRTASVSALEDTRLFRLHQEPLYELMSDRIEVVRGIIRILSLRLRERVEDVARLRNELANL